MKQIKTISILFSAVFALTACTLDNYNGPDAGLYGSIIDSETGELVEQDIVMGTKIFFKEMGYGNPSLQSMVIKNNGEYRNTMMFKGSYKIYTTIESNFPPQDTVKINLTGVRRYDFVVTPYIRITNARVFKTGRKVKASFDVQQTGDGSVSTVALFGSTQPTVGKFLNEMSSEIIAATKCYTPTTFTVEINLDDFPKIEEGKKYFFRIGALSSIGGAKYNYAPAIGIEL